VCLDTHRGVQTETVDVGAQGLARCALARHRAPQGQHLLSGAGPEGDAVSDGCGLQWPQRARLLAVSIRLGQVGLAHVLDQHAPAREQLHQTGDDRLQQRMHLVVGGRAHFDELRHAIGTTPVHPVQQQAVKMYVEVGRRAEALDQRDGAAVAFVGLAGRAGPEARPLARHEQSPGLFVSGLGLEPGGIQQMTRNHALHHLQHRRDQLGLRGQQHAQRDRQRQHPLPHRHMRDDVVYKMRCRLRHPPRAA
jgi:hypothetical protein